MNQSTTEIQPIAQEEITARSRQLWQQAGSPEGRDLEFWLAAEAELRRDREDVDRTKKGKNQKPARSTPEGGGTIDAAGKSPDAEAATRKTRRR